MDIETLKALGISPEALAERIIDQAVERLLSYTGFDEDGEETGSYASQFRKEIEERVQAAVDLKISALAADHIVPRVGEMIEKVDMRETNRYGEPVSPPMTFKEYIAHRAEAYMTEDVDFNGQSKADLEAKNESTYNWRNSGPRLSVLMRNYIHESLAKAAQGAVSDVNKVIAKNLEQATLSALKKATENLKVSISA